MRNIFEDLEKIHLRKGIEKLKKR